MGSCSRGGGRACSFKHDGSQKGEKTGARGPRSVERPRTHGIITQCAIPTYRNYQQKQKESFWIAGPVALVSSSKRVCVTKKQQCDCWHPSLSCLCHKKGKVQCGKHVCVCSHPMNRPAQTGQRSLKGKEKGKDKSPYSKAVVVLFLSAMGNSHQQLHSVISSEEPANCLSVHAVSHRGWKLQQQGAGGDGKLILAPP